MTDEVPTGRIKPADLFQHFFSVDRSEVLFLGCVGYDSDAHLGLDDRNVAITQADFVTGIDMGIGSNGCRVSQTVARNVGETAHSSVEGSGVVVLERSGPTSRIEVASDVV